MGSSGVILSVSGTLDPQTVEKAERRERPKPDYVALAADLGSTLVDYGYARRRLGPFRRLEKVLGSKAVLALACFLERGTAHTIITDGEQIGIPLALLLKCLGRGPRKTRHVMITHRLSTGAKMFFLDWLGVQSHVDTFIVYATAQKDFIESRWAIDAGRVKLVPFQVDTDFYSLEAAKLDPSDEVPSDTRPTICAVGLERRDYPTLLRAVAGLPVRVLITASSAWSKQLRTGLDTIPPNVTVKQFSYRGLRHVYAVSALMVMPLQEVDFQAGVTAILEAMAMERAVICSGSIGQTDVIVDGETGAYVPVGDAARLREAIVRLLEDPESAQRMGRNGRALVERRMSLARYCNWIRDAADLA